MTKQKGRLSWKKEIQDAEIMQRIETSEQMSKTNEKEGKSTAKSLPTG